MKLKMFIAIGVIVVVIVTIISILVSDSKVSQKNTNIDIVENKDEDTTIENNWENTVQYDGILAEYESPDRIIYYIRGNVYTFESGTDEYENIIALNRERYANEDLGMLELTVSIESEKENSGLLEYAWNDKNSIYFNLFLSDEEHPSYWCILHDGAYGGLNDYDELLNYLNSII